MTIRRRLALWYSGLLALIIVIFSITVIAVSRLTFLQTVDQVLDVALGDVADNVQITAADDPNSSVFALEVLSEQGFKAPGISVQVWLTPEGSEATQPYLVHQSQDVSHRETPLDATLLRLADVGRNTTTIEGVPTRVLAQPIYHAETQVGTIMLATHLRAVESANDMLLIIIVIGASFSVVVSVGLGLWLSERALQPIKAITQEAANIAKTEDLSTRLEWQGAMDEMGELTQVFNEMMQRLELLFNIQHRFIGDVSHELRTPLTSIIGNIEIMERYGVDDDSIESIHREADRMARMVDDLLLLTRADSGELTVDFYPLDLETIVLDVFQQGKKQAESKQQHIKLDRVEPARINGNADRIRQMLDNLLHNAVKFTATGGEITLAVYTEGNEAIIDVKDTGIGISEADLQRIFDRFYQVDSARYHHSEADGAGLGLSIASWIVDIHGGKIHVHSTLGEGTLFRTHLPLADTNNNDDSDAPPRDTRNGRGANWVKTTPRDHSQHDEAQMVMIDDMEFLLH